MNMRNPRTSILWMLKSGTLSSRETLRALYVALIMFASWTIFLFFFFQKDGAALLRYYGGSHIRALQALYPELNLKAEKFLKHLGLILLSVSFQD
jgi:hypothetical protein